MKFKVGDKVWVNNPSDLFYPIGTFSGTVSAIRPEREGVFGVRNWYLVYVDELKQEVDAPEPLLIVRHDPQLQRESLGAWDECPWIPPSVHV